MRHTIRPLFIGLLCFLLLSGTASPISSSTEAEVSSTPIHASDVSRAGTSDIVHVRNSNETVAVPAAVSSSVFGDTPIPASLSNGALDGIHDCYEGSYSRIYQPCSTSTAAGKIESTDWEQVWVYETDVSPSCVSVSPDGNYIAIGSSHVDAVESYGKVYLLDCGNSLLWSYPTDFPIVDISMRPDISLIAATGSKGYFGGGKVFFLNEQGELGSSVSGRWASFALDSAGRYSAATYDHGLGWTDRVTLYGHDEEKYLWYRNVGESETSSVSISADGEYIAVGAAKDSLSGKGGGLYLYDKAGSLLWEYEMDTTSSLVGGEKYSVSISSDGRYMAAGNRANKYLYFFESSGFLWSYDTGPIRGVSVSGDGSYIAAATSETIYLFNTHMNLLWTSKVVGLQGVAISGDATLIVAVAKDNKVYAFTHGSAISVTKAAGQVTLTEPLQVTPPGPYSVGDTLMATFTVKNTGNAPINLDKLLLGGRYNGGELPSGGYPDFTYKAVTLQPGQSHQYKGTLTIPEPGEYNFFIAYYVENPSNVGKKLLDVNNWNTSIRLAEGLADADRTRQIRVEPPLVTQEKISAPNTPTGPSSGQINQSLTYASGGASSNVGHSLEYRFDWGDGTYSGWSSSTSASHSWSNQGTYMVRAQARCATHTSVISSWSSGLSVSTSAYQWTVPPVKERGTLKIPKEILPEANGGGIPIYVPEIGENYRAVDSGWRTLREINKTKLDFDWWKLIASYSTGGADTPEGSALAAITSLVEAAGRASSVLELKLLIQKGSGGNLRAIIEVGDPRGKHFLRTYAGQTIGIPNVQDNTIRAGFSKYITTAFHLEPDAFPNIYYMMSISIDRSHKDDEIIGYLSLPEVDKIALTPKLYSADEMAIVRLREIPPKREVVIEIIGSSLSNLWEGTLTGEESSNFSEMLSEMLTTPSVETHPSSNSLQSFMERVQGIINWIRGLFGFK